MNMSFITHIKILFIILLLKGFMVFKVYGIFHEEKEICYIHETF